MEGLDTIGLGAGEFQYANEGKDDDEAIAGNVCARFLKVSGDSVGLAALSRGFRIGSSSFSPTTRASPTSSEIRSLWQSFTVCLKLFEVS